MHRVVQLLDVPAQAGFADPLKGDEGTKAEGEENQEVLQDVFHRSTARFQPKFQLPRQMSNNWGSETAILILTWRVAVSSPTGIRMSTKPSRSAHPRAAAGALYTAAPPK